MSLSIRLGLMLLCVPGLACAQHVGHVTAPVAKPPKPTIAVGAQFDRQGRLWLASVENQRLWVRVSADGGKQFSPPVQVNAAPEQIAADGENRPKIAVAADGTVLLSWTQALPQNYSGNIRFSRSVDGGKTFSAPITLNDDGRITSHRFDSLMTDGQGRVVVAWLDARDRDAAKKKASPYVGTSVYFTQSSDNGASFQPNRRLNEHNCECCRIAGSWSKEGPVVFWRNLYGTNTRDFAIAALDTGVVRRATDDEWQIDGCPHHGGGLATDPRGTLHLTWFTNGKTRQGLFYKRLAGGRDSTPLTFGNAAAQAGHSDVAVAGNQVVLTWREFNGNAYTAMAMRSDDGGQNWSAPIQLAQAAGAADYPLPVSDGKRVLVVWNTMAEGVRVMPVESGVEK